MCECIVTLCTVRIKKKTFPTLFHLISVPYTVHLVLILHHSVVFCCILFSIVAAQASIHGPLLRKAACLAANIASSICGYCLSLDSRFVLMKSLFLFLHSYCFCGGQVARNAKRSATLKLTEIHMIGTECQIETFLTHTVDEPCSCVVCVTLHYFAVA